jgi:hypothetical protein
LARAKSVRLKDKIAALKEQMKAFKALEVEVHAAPDQQISLTDPDAQAMATSGKGTGMVGYNVQTAVDAKHHLIVAHEVTNVGNDRAQLANMAGRAKAAMGVEALKVLADRGYFSGEEVLACGPLGVTPILPKPLTSGAKADGRFGKQDFIYIAEQNAYRCPAGQLLPHQMTTIEKGMTLHRRLDAKLHLLVAPVELVGVAGREAQRHERLARRGQPATLVTPPPGISAHRIVGARVTLAAEEVGDPRQRQPVLLRRRRVGCQHRLEPTDEKSQLRVRLVRPLVGERRLT